MKNVSKLLTIICLILASITAILYFLSSSFVLATVWSVASLLWAIDLGLKIKIEEIEQENYEK